MASKYSVNILYQKSFILFDAVYFDIIDIIQQMADAVQKGL